MESRFTIVEPDPLELTADTLGKDLLEAMVMELQAAPDCWQKMSQMQQDQSIDRLRARVQTFVQNALVTMFGGHFPSVAAELVSFSVKDEIKATLRMSKTHGNLHEIGEAVGTHVVVVVAATDDWTARMSEVRAKAAQGDLFRLNEADAVPKGIPGEAVALPQGGIVDLSTGEILDNPTCQTEPQIPEASQPQSGSH